MMYENIVMAKFLTFLKATEGNTVRMYGKCLVSQISPLYLYNMIYVPKNSNLIIDLEYFIAYCNLHVVSCCKRSLKQELEYEEVELTPEKAKFIQSVTLCYFLLFTIPFNSE